MTTITYSGRLRSGAAMMGHETIDSVADFVQRKYRANWQRLSVMVGDHEVGGIVASDGQHRGARHWWAES